MVFNSVTGSTPEKISIGQKLPAIDYASTITKIKELQKHYDYTSLVREVNDFAKAFKSLDDAVTSAALIEV